MPQESLNLFHVNPKTLSDGIVAHCQHFEYNKERHVIILLDVDHNIIGQLKLPLFWSIEKPLSIVPSNQPVLYLTISASHAAICVTKGIENLFHTTFSAYTTRKKQGVSQIKYLNKKGKSRAGSRVRLAATLELFESINLKLGELFEQNDFYRIGLNCSPTLIPYLMQSKVPCPFEKSDERLYKIPLHIQQSNFTCLDKAIKKLRAPILQYESAMLSPNEIWNLKTEH